MKIISILISALFSVNTYALSCKGHDFNDYIVNKHILKGNLVNKIEINKESLIYQYFLIEPIHFFTEKTNEKLIVHNIVSKSSLSDKEGQISYNYNYDKILDTTKDYYFFVDKKTNIVQVSHCSSFILETDNLTENFLEHKAISLFNNNKIEVIAKPYKEVKFYIN
jgi:hypothetical protein